MPVHRNATVADFPVGGGLGADKKKNDGEEGKKRSNSSEAKQPVVSQDKQPQTAPTGSTANMVLELHDIKCNDGLMKVEIVSNEFKGVGMKRHTEYLVKGDDSLGEINCYRRYSEFLVFR
jgi:hypothetical protein